MNTPAPLEVGIYERVPHDRYNADPCPEPSLRSSIAHTLVHRSPRHAWAAHPRLNTMIEDDDATKAMEEGTILHSMLLRQRVEIVEVDARDWRAKGAREKQQDARDGGALPILSWRMAELERCARAFHEQLADHKECRNALSGGVAETTLIWREGETWCRARPDYRKLRLPHAPFYDVKTTAGSADPETWERYLREKYALQAAWYLRGARKLGLKPSGMVFLVLETKAPYGLCAFQPGPDLLDLAEQEIAEAIELWQTCLKAGAWPGYPRQIHVVDAKPWQLANAEVRSAMKPARLAATKPTRRAIEIWNKHLLETGAGI